MVPALDPGTRVGRYTVVGPIGRGGMGGVFEVADDAGARFALKSPIHDLGATGDVTRRFAREANVLRMLDHPNLVAAIDVFVDAGQLFLVMEKVAGRPLGKHLAAGALPPRQALVITRQMLEGVEHAHARGLVHRDLKPDNVILVPQDGGGWTRVKIIDFGLVKLLGDAAAAFGAGALTRPGIVNGTPAYMAPEQALGRILDGRADLYAIGVMLFEMLVGWLPFRESDPVIMMRHQAKTPPPALRSACSEAPWCTPELAGLVDGTLVKDPAARFATARDMIGALDAAFASIDHLEA